MGLDDLEEVLRDAAEQIEGEDGAWELVIDGVRMACLTDLDFDRMRVIAPIVEDDEITDAQRREMLEANFHTALDARYATSEGVLYAAFIHPLSPLTEDELRSALEQIVNLVDSFGTTYSGGTLVFGVAPGEGGQPN